VQQGFNDIFRATDRIDVLVNNAGIGGNGVVEESTPQMFHDAFNVNVVGAVRCMQYVLPKMRAQQSGTIVNITSVVGKLAALAQAPYVASKWAFEGLSEELAQEVAPFGIRVVIIEPGVTKSSIFAKNIDAPNQTGAYDAHYRRMFAFYAAGIANATPAEEVGALIHHAITTDAPQLRYACSWGGPEIVAGRARQTDSDWVAMAATDDDSDYFAAFKTAYGVDLGKS
jgi:NAD(P)-dependent dehydrogenase (short-subunit alcohol dehydrogenase family)